MNLFRGALLFAALAASLIASSMSSAQEADLQLQAATAETGEYPNATALVTVDGRAEGAAPLTPDSFSVAIDGQPARVISADLADSSQLPLDLLLVVDTSGSMAGAPIARAKDAAKALVSSLSPADRVALIRFGDDVAVALDYTADRGAATAAIDGLVAQGNTALYQATTAAAALQQSSSASRRVVVLLSDGADFGGRSVATREEAMAAATASGVPFFTIAQGTDLDRPYLEELAARTRGRFLEAPNPDDLHALFVGIGRLLRSQYALTFDASTVAAGSQTQVSVSVNDGARTASAIASLRAGEGFVPLITLQGIAPGESISAARDITAAVAAGTPRLTWYVDGAPVLDQSAPPYTYRYDPGAFGEGEREIAVGPTGSSVRSSVRFQSALASPSGGGSSALPLIIGVAVAVIIGVLAAVAVALRARRGGASEEAAPQARSDMPWSAPVAKGTAAVVPALEPEVAETQEPIGEPLGVLVSRAGNDAGAEYHVGSQPVRIGSAARCGVRINDPEMASEEARIWVRAGHLMLHRMTHLTALEADGTVGGWQILDPGDTFQVGKHTFEFRLIPAAQAESSGDSSSGAPPPQGRRFGNLMPRSD